jgi:hypothetical protein
MRRLIRILLPAILLAMTVSCGLDSLAGGSGTETVNTYVILYDGTPAQGATVRIIDADCWLDSIYEKASPVAMRSVVDAQGRIEFTKPEKNHVFNIQIDHSDQGIFLPDVTLGDIENDTLQLQPFATYTGSFPAAENTISQMYLSGSTYQASIGSDDNFFFNGVSAGTYTLIGVSGEPLPYRVTVCGSITLDNNVSAADTNLNPAFNRLLVENFESGLGPTSLGGIVPALYWYTVSDSGMRAWKRSTDTWKWTSFAPNGSWNEIKTIAGENAGTAMRFTAVLDSGVQSPLAVAGISLKRVNKRDGWDLSAMRGFSLRSRGKGTVRVRFESKTLDSISFLLSAFTYPLKLSDTWRQNSIPVDSLRILNPVYFPNLYPWQEEAKEILRIEFEFSKHENNLGDTLYLELDDLFLEGVGVDVMMR